MASAAYRAAARFHDQRTALTHSYIAKKGVEHVAVLVPSDAPTWAQDAERLWNEAEAAERRCNASIARELIVALPMELSSSERLVLARSITQELVDRYRVGTMLALHAPDRGGDQRNHHAHLLFTTRSLGPAGFCAKVRVLDDRKTGPEEVCWLRERVAELTNAALASAGSAERVDHRTLEAQSAEAEQAGDYIRAAQLAREPTRHQGRAATAAARRGLHVQVVAENRAKRLSHRHALAAFRRRMTTGSFQASPARPFAGRTGPRRPHAPRMATVAAHPTSMDVGARRRSAYLIGLHATLRAGRRWLATYTTLVQQRAALEAWLGREENRRAWELVRHVAETHRELRRTHARTLLCTRRWQHAAVARRQAQLLFSSYRATAARTKARQGCKVPSERQMHWRRLRDAIAVEEAASDASHAVRLQARKEVSRLRNDLAAFERALRVHRPLHGSLNPSAQGPRRTPNRQQTFPRTPQPRNP